MVQSDVKKFYKNIFMNTMSIAVSFSANNKSTLRSNLRPTTIRHHDLIQVYLFTRIQEPNSYCENQITLAFQV